MKLKILSCLVIFTTISFNDLYNNPNKLVIGSAAKDQGLFSFLQQAIAHLSWCKANNKELVIDLAQDQSCPYFQEEGFHGETNPWEYYFEPVSDLKYEPGDHIRREMYDPNRGGIPYAQTSPSGVRYLFPYLEYKYWANSIIKEYIKVKPRILKKVNSFIEENFLGKKIIGIHIRGTDKKSEVTPIPPSVIFNKANELNKLNDYEFFVATDEEKILEAAKNELNGNVINYNCQRSTDGSPLHLPNSEQQKNNVAQNGEDVLVEVLLLSNCDKFVHTCSNVSASVIFFNPYIENFLFAPD